MSNTWETFKHYLPLLILFKVSLPNEDILFGCDLFMNTMFLDGKYVFEIVESATRFPAATFLDSYCINYGQSFEEI